MPTDEQVIRNVLETWMRESKSGNVAALADLMSEDVVFLVTGHPPIRGRAKFLETFQQMMPFIEMDGTSTPQEIQVSGDLAYCWNHLTVKVTPKQGGTERKRSGYTLSVFRKSPDGAWRLIRDANLLADES
ncbi:MAG: SgcJ/EcaC family oxidoreductase [Bryobacteraceae bacterium]